MVFSKERYAERRARKNAAPAEVEAPAFPIGSPAWWATLADTNRAAVEEAVEEAVEDAPKEGTPNGV